jgi:MerR family mercuric resistance operon transcriptional regulator
MTIGELAVQAAVNIQTIRFYERKGLLRKPPRTPAGYRSYEREDLDQIHFIRVCQSLGFALKEVHQLTRLHRMMASPIQGQVVRPTAVREIVAIAEQRIESIDEKLHTLGTMKQELQQVVTALTNPKATGCPAARA